MIELIHGSWLAAPGTSGSGDERGDARMSWIESLLKKYSDCLGFSKAVGDCPHLPSSSLEVCFLERKQRALDWRYQAVHSREPLKRTRLPEGAQTHRNWEKTGTWPAQGDLRTLISGGVSLTKWPRQLAGKRYTSLTHTLWALQSIWNSQQITKHHLTSEEILLQEQRPKQTEKQNKTQHGENRDVAMAARHFRGKVNTCHLNCYSISLLPVSETWSRSAT